MFSCEFSEISKNVFFHKSPPVAASGITSFSKWIHITQDFISSIFELHGPKVGGKEKV